MPHPSEIMVFVFYFCPAQPVIEKLFTPVYIVLCYCKDIAKSESCGTPMREQPVLTRVVRGVGRSDEG
jgi:hypothetical protein